MEERTTQALRMMQRTVELLCARVHSDISINMNEEYVGSRRLTVVKVGMTSNGYLFEGSGRHRNEKLARYIAYKQLVDSLTDEFTAPPWFRHQEPSKILEEMLAIHHVVRTHQIWTNEVGLTVARCNIAGEVEQEAQGQTEEIALSAADDKCIKSWEQLQNRKGVDVMQKLYCGGLEITRLE